MIKDQGPIHTMHHVSVVAIPSKWSVFTLSVTFRHLPEQHMIVLEAYDYSHQIIGTIHFLKDDWHH
jgi:hypothetical protein